jgi:hypothetical protein
MPGSQHAPFLILFCPISYEEMGFFIRLERRRKNNIMITDGCWPWMGPEDYFRPALILSRREHDESPWLNGNNFADHLLFGLLPG